MGMEANAIYRHITLSSGEEIFLSSNPFAECKDLFDSFFGIYERSIEPSEQQSKHELEKCFSTGSHLFSVLVSSGNVLSGSIYWLDRKTKLALLAYMATDNRVRSRGYGGKLLSQTIVSMMNEFGIEEFIIEVDSVNEKNSPDLGIRVLRQHFYEKHGARKILGLNYECPIAHDGYKPEMELQIISKAPSASIQTSKLKSWVEQIYIGAYGLDKFDSRIVSMFKDSPSKYHAPQKC